MKICKECRHMNKYTQCEHPDIPLLDLVEGKHHVYLCEVARHEETLCGVDGKLFSSKTDSNDGKAS